MYKAIKNDGKWIVTNDDTCQTYSHSNGLWVRYSNKALAVKMAKELNVQASQRQVYRWAAFIADRKYNKAMEIDK